MKTESISALEKFLSYGPIGLAGLMLVLVVLALSFRELTPQKASLLKFFMVVGGLCFGAALLAQTLQGKSSHPLTVVVAPNDLGQANSFPPPIIRFNGKKISRTEPMIVGNSATLLIDVTDALGIYKTVSNQNEQKDVALKEAAELTDQLNNSVATLKRSVAATAARPASPDVQRTLNGINTIQRNLGTTLGVFR